jgi:hypothetical protein
MAKHCPVVVLALCLVVTVAAVAYAARQVKAAKVLQAQRFELVDSAGRVRAELGLSPEGNPALTLWSNKAGASKVHTRASLWLAKDGSPRLSLWDGDGQERAGIWLESDGYPALRMWDSAGKLRVAAGEFMKDGSPSIILKDSAGQDRAILGVAPLETVQTGEKRTRAESSVVLFDKEGQTIWQAP